MVDDSERQEREKRLTSPPPPVWSCSGPKTKKKKRKCTWAAVNYSRRKQSAFPEGVSVSMTQLFQRT